MMDFISPCSKKSTERSLWPSIVVWLVSVWLAVAAHASGIDILQFAMTATEDGVQVNADFDFEISSELENLVERGVTLSFKAEIEMHRSRWYWFDERVLKKSQTVSLSYHALTRQYRVAIGELRQTYGSLREALRRVSRLRNWRVIERNHLESGVDYEVMFRYFLDISQLPKPLQVTAFTSGGWDLSASLYEEHYTLDEK